MTKEAAIVLALMRKTPMACFRKPRLAEVLKRRQTDHLEPHQTERGLSELCSSGLVFCRDKRFWLTAKGKTVEWEATP